MAYSPKSRTEFWEAKFAGNVERDARKIAELSRAGWRPVIIWECETRGQDRLREIIRERIMQHPVQPPYR